MGKQTLTYPQPKEELIKIAQRIFTSVKNRYCITCMFPAGTGKRVLIKFLLQEEKIIKEIFKTEYEKTIFVYIDADEVLNASNEAYLALILENLLLKINEKSIKIDKKNTIPNPLILIKKYSQELINQGYHIVFLLNDFEFTLQLSPTIYRNLESILSIKKNQITFVFLSTINLLEEGTLSHFHNLKYAINRIVYFHPLMSDEQIMYVLTSLSKSLGVKFNEKDINLLKNLGGGHAQLLKYSATILKNTENNIKNNTEKVTQYLLNHEQLRSVCLDIWNYFNDNEKEILINVVRTGKILEDKLTSANFLINTNVIKTGKDEAKYMIFGKLFENFIINQVPAEKLSYDEQTNQIFYGILSCGDKLTLQEFKLLSYFLKNEGKVVSRDEVGQVLWGRNYAEQYSDYSIDKLISSIRKKLDEINFPSYKLVTLKKRGFTFSN